MVGYCRERCKWCKREKPTPVAARKCAEWMSECLRIGWHKDDRAFLEQLWWRHHDNYGNLK